MPDPRMEALRVRARRAPANRTSATVRSGRQANDCRRLAVLEPFARFRNRLRARNTAPRGARRSRGRPPTSPRARAGTICSGTLAPQPRGDLRHAEVLASGCGRAPRASSRDRAQRTARVSSGAAARPIASFSAAEADQLAELGRQLGILLAQREDLALGDRDRVAAVRMRHEDLRDLVRIVLEELRDSASDIPATSRVSIADRLSSRCRRSVFICRRVADRMRRHRPLALEHVAAGPFIRTGCPSPCQPIVSAPPRVCTRTSCVEQAATNACDDRGARAGAASERLARAALVHAQPNVSAIDDLHVTRVRRAPESADAARSAGPRSSTGAASTSATTCTACGLPIDSARDLQRTPSTSSGSTSAPVPPVERDRVRGEIAARPCPR